MNPALEKMLREFAQTRFFGSVEIIYNNGAPITVHVKKTLKMTGSNEPNSQREHRGDSHGNQQPDTR